MKHKNPYAPPLEPANETKTRRLQIDLRNLITALSVPLALTSFTTVLKAVCEPDIFTFSGQLLNFAVFLSGPFWLIVLMFFSKFGMSLDFTIEVISSCLRLAVLLPFLVGYPGRDERIQPKVNLWISMSIAFVGGCILFLGLK